MMKFHGIVNGFARKFDISLLYNSSVGIKSYNQIITSDLFEYFVTKKEKILRPEQLELGLDGLKDTFSLLGTSLINSPHLDLMKKLYNSDDIINSDYMARAASGTLDFRPGRKITSGFLEHLLHKYHHSLKLVSSEAYDPIKIFCVGSKYIIADGKHTAAICALLGTQVVCLDATPLVYDSFFHWVYRKLKKDPRYYRKHMDYFDSIYTKRLPSG